MPSHFMPAPLFLTLEAHCVAFHSLSYLWSPFLNELSSFRSSFTLSSFYHLSLVPLGCWNLVFLLSHSLLLSSLFISFLLLLSVKFSLLAFHFHLLSSWGNRCGQRNYLLCMIFFLYYKNRPKCVHWPSY